MSLLNRMWTLAVASLIISTGSGCATDSQSPYTGSPSGTRSPLLAERLTQQAVAAIDKGDADRGEVLLRQALAADLYHGPAHNNLGVLLLEQGELYEAAAEFEWARKLMPGHPDPRTNLAMTLERAGQVDSALAEYREALETWPGHMPAVQAYAKCQLRHRLPQEDLPEMLQSIVMSGESEEWRDWGRLQLAKLESGTE